MAPSTPTPTDASIAVNKTNYYSPPKDFVEFENTKAGVKGLVDCGIGTIPRFFVHSKGSVPSSISEASSTDLQVPIIDLESLDKDEASYNKIVDEIFEASTSWGVFHLVNHGVPKNFLYEVLEKVRGFHEGDNEVKEKHYSRDFDKKVRFISNLCNLQAGAATWRDMLVCRFDQATLDGTEIPSICRDTLVEYKEKILVVADRLCQLLSVALGLPADRMKGAEYTAMQVMYSHYYPSCPEPELTMGYRMHTDPTFVTVLLQDSLGGLQVLHDGYLVDVTPVPGALLVNIGDLLKCFTNEKFQSSPHRVLASRNGPRISVATLLAPALDGNKRYGPLPELLSSEEPPLYKDFLMADYIEANFAKAPNRTALSYFKV